MLYRITLIVFVLATYSYADECRNPVVSGPPIFPPYIIANEDGSRSGVAIDKAMSVLTPILGAPILDETAPWLRVLKDFEDGAIDILFVTLYDPSRESFARFTRPWAFDNYGVVTLSDFDFEWKGIESLEGLKGGYYHGTNLPPPFGGFVKANNKVEGILQVDSMYKMLSTNRVDYLIVALETFQLLRPDTFEAIDFRVHNTSTVSIPIHMAVSKNSPCIERFDEINEAVRSD